MTGDNRGGLGRALDTAVEDAFRTKLGISAKAGWVPYQGDRGGVGWQNPESGEVIYDDEPPGGTPEGIPDSLDELEEQIESGELTEEDVMQAVEDEGGATEAGGAEGDDGPSLNTVDDTMDTDPGATGSAGAGPEVSPGDVIDLGGHHGEQEIVGIDPDTGRPAIDAGVGGAATLRDDAEYELADSTEPGGETDEGGEPNEGMDDERPDPERLGVEADSVGTFSVSETDEGVSLEHDDGGTIDVVPGDDGWDVEAGGEAVYEDMSAAGAEERAIDTMQEVHGDQFDTMEPEDLTSGGADEGMDDDTGGAPDTFEEGLDETDLRPETADVLADYMRMEADGPEDVDLHTLQSTTQRMGQWTGDDIQELADAFDVDTSGDEPPGADDFEQAVRNFYDGAPDIEAAAPELADAYQEGVESGDDPVDAASSAAEEVLDWGPADQSVFTETLYDELGYEPGLGETGSGYEVTGGEDDGDGGGPDDYEDRIEQVMDEQGVSEEEAHAILGGGEGDDEDDDFEEKLDRVVDDHFSDVGLVAKADWVPYSGPRGGEGWKNAETGDVSYDDEPPGEVNSDAVEQMRGAVANRLAGASRDDLEAAHEELVDDGVGPGADDTELAQDVVDNIDDHKLAELAQDMGAEVGAAAGSSGAIETEGATTAGDVSEGDGIVIDDTEAEVSKVSDMGGGFYVAARDPEGEVHTARVGADHEFDVPAGDGGGDEPGGDGRIGEGELDRDTVTDDQLRDLADQYLEDVDPESFREAVSLSDGFDSYIDERFEQGKAGNFVDEDFENILADKMGVRSVENEQAQMLRDEDVDLGEMMDGYASLGGRGSGHNMMTWNSQRNHYQVRPDRSIDRVSDSRIDQFEDPAEAFQHAYDNYESVNLGQSVEKIAAEEGFERAEEELGEDAAQKIRDGQMQTITVDGEEYEPDFRANSAVWFQKPEDEDKLGAGMSAGQMARKAAKADTAEVSGEPRESEVGAGRISKKDIGQTVGFEHESGRVEGTVTNAFDLAGKPEQRIEIRPEGQPDSAPAVPYDVPHDTNVEYNPSDEPEPEPESDGGDGGDEGDGQGPKAAGDLTEDDVGREVSVVDGTEEVHGELVDVREGWRDGQVTLRIDEEGTPDDWPPGEADVTEGTDVALDGDREEVPTDELGLRETYSDPTDGRGSKAFATDDGEINLQLGWNDANELASVAGEAAEYMEGFDQASDETAAVLRDVQQSIKGDLPTSPSTGDPYDPEDVEVDPRQLEVLKNHIGEAENQRREQNAPQDRIDELRSVRSRAKNALRAAQADGGGSFEKAAFDPGRVVSDIEEGLEGVLGR